MKKVLSFLLVIALIASMSIMSYAEITPYSLQSLELIHNNEEIELNRDFHSNVRDYTCIVENDVDVINVKGEMVDSKYRTSSAIFINYKKYEDGELSSNIYLPLGTSKLNIRCENLAGMKLYTVKIHRKSTDESYLLDNLELSYGNIDFNSNVFEYEINVPRTVSAIKFNVDEDNFYSDVELSVNGQKINNNNWSQNFSLQDGKNAFSLKLQTSIFETEILSHIYTIIVNKEDNIPDDDEDTSGGSSGTNVEKANLIETINTDTNTATIRVTNTTLQDLFNSISVEENEIKLAIIKIPKIEDSEAYKVILPKEVFSKQESTAIKVETEIADIILPDNMLESVEDFEEIGINIKQTDKTQFTEELQQEIGDKPVIDLHLDIDGELKQWYNPESKVVVSIPYTPTEEELQNQNNIVVWYVDSSGNVVNIPNGSYDKETQSVVFETNHFSSYTIATVVKNFEDTNSEAVNYLSARGVINGVTETRFEPNNTVTRAEFVTMLTRALELRKYCVNNFDDVQLEDYFYDSVGTVKELNIVNGVGDNKFNPDGNITLEHVNIILSNLGIIIDNEEGLDYNKDMTRLEVAEVLYELIK